MSALRPTLLALALSAIALTTSACGSDACSVSGTAAATATDRVTVDYVGRLEDGSEFDSGQCASFPLQNVIPGFRDGIVGMVPGQEKTITVPPEQGYGNRPPPGIPAGATLIFDVTLLQVQ